MGMGILFGLRAHCCFMHSGRHWSLHIASTTYLNTHSAFNHNGFQWIHGDQSLIDVEFHCGLDWRKQGADLSWSCDNLGRTLSAGKL